MPSKVKKRGKIRWMGRVQKDGQIRQKICGTKSEALAWEAEQRDVNWTTRTDSLTLIDWANRYLDYAKARFVQKTIHEKIALFQRFFRKFPPDMEVNRLGPGDVLSYLQAQAQDRSGYAANKDRKNLVAAWNWGMKYIGLGKPNPCLVDKFPEIRQPRYIPPEEDFWAIYDVAVGQDKVMLTVALYLAARRGEIFRLTWADVDFGQQRVRLSTRKREGGSLEYDWLPMTDKLREQLLWWWENRTFRRAVHVFLCEERTPFCLENYGQPFKARHHFLRRLCGRAGIEAFGFHAIRHLTASILYKKGYPVSVIQAILRHKNPNTTSLYLKSLGLEDTRPALESLSLDQPRKVLEFTKKEPPNATASGGE